MRWSVDQVNPAATDRIMEIGCGGGTAAALVCARLVSGSLVAIDRSATAVKKTLTRNEECVAAGRLTVIQAPFTAAGVGDLGPFDKIFSINVNLFWTSPAVEELALLRRLLVPGGTMFACWGRGPTPGRSDEIARRTASRFAESGFETTVTSADGLQCVAASPEP
ncbi:class I SAM-dependent methyltransferase [Asanoa sp. WMMD1127]|uniref:SAM-dependent methyltransferase n=1 Tax=Asanoa sp. WMMD1127 TaxID=3016107 RepID=UPI002416B162|nr:class I SAM-dependent methyltransferase [Asanoa sp. WMMD1127]MDG4821671.1 class I SAM-dependent methyltransferase [Asanoa sp. WMMD1127]